MMRRLSGRTYNVADARSDIIAAVRNAGIAGAGGAGFPAHVKFANTVDTVIANGAECEPILEADKYLMEREADAIVRGLELVMGQVGASRGYVAIKNKNTAAIVAIEQAMEGKSSLSVAVLGNYYPAGDEQVLIRQVTGRMVPPAGLPFMVGVTVSNVATLKQVADAVDGANVTSRVVTVGGEVSRPVTLVVPIGASIGGLIDLAGGSRLDNYEIIVGGPVMGCGAVRDDPLTKTLGGGLGRPDDQDV
jgi:Na+-translocating ferredoxin:NAD+ oxidoreductase RnfC subunit